MSPNISLGHLQILDLVADGMVFGALLPCEECSGQLVFKSDAYYCTGDITAWTKCLVKTQTPNRKDWVTPKVNGAGGSGGVYWWKNMVPPPGIVLFMLPYPGHSDNMLCP